MNRPNILLIVDDQHRGDCLGIAGHPDVKTPYLDSLAIRGVLFENAYSACPTCIPARAALMTGMAQENHKRVGYRDGVSWDYEHTLAGELSKAGYYTQGVGKMHVSPLRNLLGFHHIELHDGYLHHNRYATTPYYESQKVADDYFYWLKQQKGIDCDVTDTGLECNSWVARPWIYEEKLHPTNWAVDRSLDFLRRRDRSKPFFLMTSFVRPHPPFDAPQCYFDMYKDKALTQPHIGEWADVEKYKILGRGFDSSDGIADPELVRQAQVGYYACITHMDHQIGRLIQALIEEQIYNDTVILFVSDHGELLGDHHMCRKTRAYQGSIKVPFILSGPNHLVNANAKVDHRLVELRDVMPTLLDFAGAEIPESVDGKSVRKLDAEKPEKFREYIHGEHTGGRIGNQYIVTENAKYIWYTQTGEEQFFDLEKDPYEMVNEIDSMIYQGKINYLRNILIKELKNRPEGYSDGKKLVVGCKERAILV
ncbi:MAG: arylsulfatase [Cellulosilyticaceae bacterium]